MSTESTTTTIATMKTLPMKFKAMHYAILAYITQSDEFTAVQKVSLIAKLPVLDTIENQISFYEKMVDFKIVEKDIVKPMIKKGKQDTAKATASASAITKKPRASKKQKVEVTAVLSTNSTPSQTQTELKLTLPTLIIEEVVNNVINEVPKNEVPKNEVNEVPKNEVKAVPKVVKKAAAASAKKVPKEAKAAPAEKKKRTVKKIVPKTTLPEQEETDNQQPNEEMLLTDEMKEEPYHNQKLERPVLKRALNKVEDIEVEHWLIFREGIKYWTTDEEEQNGIVYDYDHDTDGDGVPGTVVGKLVNGKLLLNN
jgi:hypothetical protein